KRGKRGRKGRKWDATLLEYPPIPGILAPAQILAHPRIPSILVQMHGAGEFDSPLPRLGNPVQKSPLPFQLTPFDPHSEISQRKPCHPVCVLGHAVGIPAAISGAFPNQPPRKTPHFRATSKLCLQFYLALFFLETLASGL